MNAILLAPASVGLFYLLFAAVGSARDPEMDVALVIWAVGQIALVAYVVLAPLGALLMFLWRSADEPPLWVSVPVGMFAGFAAALVADLPEPNLARVRYYFFAAIAGALWGIAFRSLSIGERNPWSGRTIERRDPREH